MADDNKPTPEAIKAQLEQILQCAEFRSSEKQRNFLRFIVDETLEGREAEIKGYAVAVSVYGRSESFDPQVDPIVRVEAGRLRRALERYYLTAGKNDPLRINIPKGSYIPAFRNVQIEPPVSKTSLSGPQDRAFAPQSSIAVMPLASLSGDKDQEY